MMVMTWSRQNTRWLYFSSTAAAVVVVVVVADAIASVVAGDINIGQYWLISHFFARLRLQGNCMAGIRIARPPPVLIIEYNHIFRKIHPSLYQLSGISVSVAWVRGDTRSSSLYVREPSIQGEGLSDTILVSIFDYIFCVGNLSSLVSPPAC